MKNNKLEQLVFRLENYLECWKQFNGFINLARSKKFTGEDETQFLEVKSVLAQELEMILAAFQAPPINREEIHSLIGGASSLRQLSELNEPSIRNTENQWHKLFITMQSLLGQLKVQQREMESQSGWSNFFSRKKKS